MLSETLHPSNAGGAMSARAGQALSQLDGDACARRYHSAEKYGDKKLDERSPYAENSDGDADTHPPNPTEQP